MKKLIVFFVTIAVIFSASACFGPDPYELPEDAIAFENGSFTNPDNADDGYNSLSYNGRTYIAFGTQGGKFVAKNSISRVLGYYVQDGVEMKDISICLLAEDPDANFLLQSDKSLMGMPFFFRAIDTKGQDITIPDYICDLGYEFWQ